MRTIKKQKKYSLNSLLRVLLVTVSLSALFSCFIQSTPQRVYAEPEEATMCSAKVTKEDANCEMVQDCDKDIGEDKCGITRYLKLFINTLSALVGIVVVGSLVIGGIQYSTSAGDPNAAGAAKKRIANAILALVAFGLMYGFLQWVVPGGVL